MLGVNDFFISFQIPYYETGSSKFSLALVHHSAQKTSFAFGCSKEIDFDDFSLPKIPEIHQNRKFCNMNGLLFVKKGDLLWLESLSSEPVLDLTKDEGYFGGVKIGYR